jgi:hypothetical protein
MLEMPTTDAEESFFSRTRIYFETIEHLRRFFSSKGESTTDAQVAAQVVSMLAALCHTSKQNARTIVRVHNRFCAAPELLAAFPISDLALLCQIKFDKDVQAILAVKQLNPKLKRVELKRLIHAARGRAIDFDERAEEH